MSEVKVNKISPRTACGTVTLGDSGDTFTIPSGATITNAGTASGFGATGETSWDTTVKTTGTFTATAGVGYFLDTTGGIITVNLPVGAAGSSVAMADYAATWQTNNVTVAANGSEKIGGDTNDATLNTGYTAAEADVTWATLNQNAAQYGISVADSAIKSLAKSIQNVGDNNARLSSKEESLSLAISNTEATRSRIEDADFAKEQMAMMKLQILQQTTMSSFSQANSAPQMVLSLFR